MTWKDPNNPDFIRKLVDYYDCVKDYFKISNEEKLRMDLKKPDIDLVCFYELKVLRDHVRDSKLNYTDLIKVTPPEERAYLEKFHHKV